MARFHVKQTLELPDRKLFVLAGTILEGSIEAGMFLRIPCNSLLEITARIHSIEFALRRGGKEDVCLCIETDPELAEILCGLDIGDETFDVTTDGSD